ncbi:hypothetical protein CFC21_067005 [Triticum aestivum]|uniref:Uncharacterized protein n=2 Tax=Triticum aestivum TaxID=4565 RepID=A0A9R1H7I8_WHEAT|nr:hypothetical protein CFC21_067005 [Triticum aestivum]
MDAVVPEMPDLNVEKPAVDAGHSYGGTTAGCRGRPRALLAKLEAWLLGALAAGGRAPRVRRTPAAGGPAPRCLRARAGAILRDEARVTVAPEMPTSDTSCEIPAVDAEPPDAVATTPEPGRGRGGAGCGSDDVRDAGCGHDYAGGGRRDAGHAGLPSPQVSAAACIRWCWRKGIKTSAAAGLVSFRSA